MNLFDKKLKYAKDQIRSVKLDHSATHTVLMELKRTVREVNEKVNELEEQNEILDLSEIEGKATITVADVVAAMKTLQQNVLDKVCSQANLDECKQHIRGIEERYDLLDRKFQSELEFR